MFFIVGQIRKNYLRADPTLRKPSDSRSQEESAYAGYHLAYEVKKLMYASVVNATLYCDYVITPSYDFNNEHAPCISSDINF